MIQMRKICILLLGLVICTSCSKKPKFIQVDNVSILGLKDSLLLVTMDYVVYNPNDVKTKLRQSGMEIFYKDSLVGNGYLDKQINLVANDTLSVPVRFEIAVAKLHKYYPELISSDSTVFSIKGNSRVSFLLNSFTIDMDDEIHLNTKGIIHEQIQKNLSTADNFKIRSISSNRLPSFNRTKLQLQIETNNNLPLDYVINELQLDFYLDKRRAKVANWQLSQPLRQKSLEKALIPVDVTLNNFDILKQAKLSWLTKTEVNFSILGEIEVQIEGYEFRVPIEDNINLAL